LNPICKVEIYVLKTKNLKSFIFDTASQLYLENRRSALALIYIGGKYKHIRQSKNRQDGPAKFSQYNEG
jgi:hypothetical protein